MTDQPKWTPGPWRATTHDHPEQGVYAGYRIAKMTGGEIQRDRANANLIAAAPDLYEALAPLYAVAIDRAVDAPEWRDKDTVSVLISIGELRAIRAALAKARGETK